MGNCETSQGQTFLLSYWFSENSMYVHLIVYLQTLVYKSRIKCVNWHFYLKTKSIQIVFFFARLGDSALLMQFLAQWMDVMYSFKPLIVNHFHIVVTFAMSRSIAEM